MIARRLKPERHPRRVFDDDELAHVLAVWKATGSEQEAADDFDPALSPEECERALAIAQQKWPQDFESVLANEGVSDVSVARAHREALRDPKVSFKHAETIHRLKGRLTDETTDFEKGLNAAMKFAAILSGKEPVPVIDVTPLPIGQSASREESS